MLDPNRPFTLFTNEPAEIRAKVFRYCRIARCGFYLRESATGGRLGLLGGSVAL